MESTTSQPNPQPAPQPTARFSSNAEPAIVQLSFLSHLRQMLVALLVLASFGGGANLAYADTQVAAPTASAVVNINTADADQLASVLKGIGLRRAEAIVAYRQENGNFVDAYELTAIKGIGDRIVEQNEAKILLRD